MIKVLDTHSLSLRVVWFRMSCSALAPCCSPPNANNAFASGFLPCMWLVNRPSLKQSRSIKWGRSLYGGAVQVTSNVAWRHESAGANNNACRNRADVKIGIHYLITKVVICFCFSLNCAAVYFAFFYNNFCGNNWKFSGTQFAVITDQQKRMYDAWA